MTHIVLLLHAEAPMSAADLPLEVHRSISPEDRRARLAAAAVDLPCRFMLGIRYFAIGRRGAWRGRDLFELRLRPWWSRGGLRIDVRFGALARWS